MRARRTGPLGLRVCETCLGRGRIYRRRGRPETCPDCGGRAGNLEREAEQNGAVAAVRVCFRKLEAGETGPFNFELAVRGALQSGLTVEQISKRTGVPIRRLRGGSNGQAELGI